MADMNVMSADGYDALGSVLRRAFKQASAGKGRERHANGKPFTEQPMLSINRTLGSIDGILFQAAKKAGEARGLPTVERSVAELLGAINYLAGAVILLEEGMLHGKKSIAADDKPASQARKNTDRDGWISNGGSASSPILGSQMVRVKLLNGNELVERAGFFDWTFDGQLGDIVAYKVLDAA